MRRIIGICLLSLGGLVFLWSGHGFFAFMTTTKEEFIARYEKRGIDANKFYKEGIDAHFRNGRRVTGITMLVGLMVAAAGLRVVMTK